METNLLNFITANSGSGIAPVSLRPRTLADLGDRAVIEHDVNVYDVLIQLGATYRPQSVARAGLNFDMLHVPQLDPEPGRRRWLNLDIQSALCLMNIPFAACLSLAEYERAVHSMRLDDSLLIILSELTGDATFLRWRQGGVTVRVDSAVDVPRAVYEHAVICEYAHERGRGGSTPGTCVPSCSSSPWQRGDDGPRHAAYESRPPALILVARRSAAAELALGEPWLHSAARSEKITCVMLNNGVFGDTDDQLSAGPTGVLKRRFPVGELAGR